MWAVDRSVINSKIDRSGMKLFLEECCDQYMINFFIQSLALYFPALKKQIIDKRDQRLFRKIDQCGGKRIVAVVNQWHMEGIEHLWCHAYG